MDHAWQVRHGQRLTVRAQFIHHAVREVLPILSRALGHRDKNTLVILAAYLRRVNDDRATDDGILPRKGPLLLLVPLLVVSDAKAIDAKAADKVLPDAG